MNKIYSVPLIDFSKILTRANNNKMIKFVFRPPTTDASIDDIAAAGQ